jgi:hypothetical protein
MKVEKYNKAKAILVIFCLSIPILTVANINQDNVMIKIKEGIQSEEIAFKLTEPEEIMALFEEPQKKTERTSGGMLVLEWDYPDLHIVFGKMRDDPAPFTLREMLFHNKPIDIGQNKKLVLRTNEDLRKIDRFWGLANISLEKLDLRDKRKVIDSMNFDSLTEWPPTDRMPEGFDPDALIENGKNPGLGIRSLHESGIDGRGVGIAIIDQPLLLGHVEYTSRLIRYDATGLGDISPQMHGSPVASIAVGKNIGVAPGASLTYFAIPMWERDNRPYIKTMKKIFDLNEQRPEKEKIRVASISTGMFPQQEHFEEWKTVLKQAEDKGILVVTCDPAILDYGILSLTIARDPDDVRSYTPGIYVSESDVLRVPGANKTVGSHRGDDVYTFDRTGGMSWGAPYIAGLAALAFQVNAGITPKLISESLVETVTHTDAGPIVNPQAFIEKVKTHH